jgi:hypothetical protein
MEADELQEATGTIISSILNIIDIIVDSGSL